jgi:hypothetical protein
MMSESFNVFGQTVGVEPLDDVHDLPMKGAPLLDQKTSIGDLVRERVLEGVLEVGKQAGSARLAKRQGELLAKLVRWYTPAETLAMATGTNAQLLALSGKRNPYPGKLGVVEQGALADLLLVDGDPIANIKLIEDPAKNFVVIMKDGKIYKNTLDPSMALTGK